MKRQLFTFTLFLLVAYSYAQYTAIPDPNFENELSAYDDISNDGQVPTANINTIISLNVGQKNIADLTGIEDFTALEQLLCYGNQLTALDVSQNGNLKLLSFEQNQITTIDISQNLLLEKFYANNNSISNIDISQNSLLIEFHITFNNLTNIDLSNQNSLIILSVIGNQLTSLDVSQNILLEKLYCYSNSLTTLDVSLNANLTHLSCGVNQLTSIDVSLNHNLILLSFFNNPLTSVNVKNGNNTNFTEFMALNTPSLTCILVDDAAWSTINWLDIDVASTFVNNQAACDSLGTDSLGLNESLDIFPNPFRNKFTITTKTEATYSLNTISGEIIKKGILLKGDNSIQISNLSKGMYFIQIENEEGVLTKKVLKK